MATICSLGVLAHNIALEARTFSSWYRAQQHLIAVQYRQEDGSFVISQRADVDFRGLLWQRRGIPDLDGSNGGSGIHKRGQQAIAIGRKSKCGDGARDLRVRTRFLEFSVQNVTSLSPLREVFPKTTRLPSGLTVKSRTPAYPGSRSRS